MSMGRGGVFGDPDQFMGGGMFGRRKGLFGRTADMAQQFMPQIAPETQGAIDQYAAMPQQEAKKPGFFGQGGVGRAIAGYLGDALLRQADMAPIYTPSMMQQRQLEAMTQQAEAQRRAKFDDWRQQYDYERTNPKASTNDTVADYTFMTQTLGKDAADKWLARRGDPFINTTLPNGQFYSGPQSGLETALRSMGQGAQQGSPPPKPVGKLTPIAPGGATGNRPFDAPPQRLSSGTMTSGRRTPEGNRIVGGVPNSRHLTGEAADFVGPDLNALLAEARKLPGLRRAFIHKDHVHTEGDWNVPYFGKRGTAGLKGR